MFVVNDVLFGIDLEDGSKFGFVFGVFVFVDLLVILLGLGIMFFFVMFLGSG